MIALGCECLNNHNRKNPCHHCPLNQCQSPSLLLPSLRLSPPLHISSPHFPFLLVSFSLSLSLSPSHPILPLSLPFLPSSSMSRSSRSHQPNMGPPPDVVMGPPPLPPQVGVFHAAPQNPSKPVKDAQDVAEKYRKLKRRYFDLEEVRISSPRSSVIAQSDLTSFHPLRVSLSSATQGCCTRAQAVWRESGGLDERKSVRRVALLCSTSSTHALFLSGLFSSASTSSLLDNSAPTRRYRRPTSRPTHVLC